MTNSERIRKFYQALHKKFGPQGWWPGESALECILGAILTQNTSWKNVEKAIDNLKRENLISVEDLSLIKADELAELIRPSGYYNQKALKIKNFISFLVDEFSGSLDSMFATEKPHLRKKLLSIKGIGPETADSIMLYAGGIPVFVVDAYTWRVLHRHGLVPEQTSYDEIQEIFTDSLADDAGMFNEYHALLVKLAKEHCKKRDPICSGCPLEYDP
ncbi:MAG TPA: endonuclease III domain-containing protein, partial [Thermodesulfobacteriota bacterium]|nr:endonuclease III domain-containing protein [Thermodesulfobacteriota bacterium]